MGGPFNQGTGGGTVAGIGPERIPGEFQGELGEVRRKNRGGLVAKLHCRNWAQETGGAEKTGQVRLVFDVALVAAKGGPEGNHAEGKRVMRSNRKFVGSAWNIGRILTGVTEVGR